MDANYYNGDDNRDTLNAVEPCEDCGVEPCQCAAIEAGADCDRCGDRLGVVVYEHGDATVCMDCFSVLDNCEPGDRDPFDMPSTGEVSTRQAAAQRLK